MLMKPLPSTTSSRFATLEQDEDGLADIVISGRSPTPAKVLDPNADLRSWEERKGGRVLNVAGEHAVGRCE